MIGGLQGEFGDLDIKYLKQNISKSRSKISEGFRRNSVALCKMETWWDNALPEASTVRASLEGKQLFAAEVQRWVLEWAPLTGLSCGLKERKTWPLWFAPFRVAEIWPEVTTGEYERRFVRCRARARKWTVCKYGALSFWNPFAAQMTGIYKNNGILRVILSFAEKG